MNSLNKANWPLQKTKSIKMKWMYNKIWRAEIPECEGQVSAA